MRLPITCLGAVALSIFASGCVGGADPQPEGPLGAASEPQIDPYRAYTILQSGITVGSAWHGTISSGVDTEYWVSLPGYSASATRSFNGSSQTCAAWKRSVCGSSFSGATYYKAVVSQTTLDCGLPPGPCTPSTGAVSFLGSGSYQTLNALGLPFGWTYVSGSCEYWAMNHTISSGSNTQSPTSPGWSSLSGFETAMCSMSAVPTTWFSVYYEPVANFCSSTTC